MTGLMYKSRVVFQKKICLNVSALPDDGVITPSELAILDSLIQGGKALSLKVKY